MATGPKRDQIKELLGSGLGPEVVSAAVGCDISYVSQLLSDEAFANEVASLRTIALASYSKRDESINTIEDKLIKLLGAAVDDNSFYKPRDLLQAFTVLNSAKRRGSQNLGTGNTVNNIVQLTLPESVVRRFTTNRTNEVIEVEGQTMVTMPAGTLLRKLATEDAANGKQGKYLEVAKLIPGGSNFSDTAELTRISAEDI